MIFSLFCQIMLVLTDLKHPLGLKGTRVQRDKDNNSVPGIDKLFTAPQIKGNIFTEEQVYYYSNRQTSASSRSERHADAQMT